MSEQQESAEPSFRVEHRMVGDAAVVAIFGEVDADTAPLLAEAVREGLDRTRAPFCVLDLTNVDYLGGAGLQTLAKTRHEAERRREPLRVVVDANRPVIRPLEITGLEEVLALYHSVDEALGR
ncbi:anti-sigma factor antagonist [Nocardia sp. NPDC051832]|uniref:anti-sigma factor antagonist n=1 Tax=Nocardia sp. NPDC051832 TaxID=3155673 RepID=UPI0034239EC7